MASLCWSDKHAASMEGERGELTKSLGTRDPCHWNVLKCIGQLPLSGTSLGHSYCECLPHRLFSTPFGPCSLNCKWSVAAQIFTLVRKKSTEHKAELLPQMPLSSEFWVIVPQLLISQGSLTSFPVTAGPFLAALIFVPPTQQSEQGPSRFVAKRTSAQLRKSRHSGNVVEKAKEHWTSSTGQGHTLLQLTVLSLPWFFLSCSWDDQMVPGCRCLNP